MAAAARRKPELVAEPEVTGPGSDDDFEFDTDHGLITLPPLGAIPVGVIRKARHKSGIDQLIDVIEAVASPAVLDIIDQMKSTELGKLNDAWVAHSGVSLGESAAS